jgi:hypothetical protein
MVKFTRIPNTDPPIYNLAFGDLVNRIDGFKIKVLPKEVANDQGRKQKLFFINLGGYVFSINKYLIEFSF